MKPLTMQLSPVPQYFFPLLPFLSDPFTNALNLRPSLNVKFQMCINNNIYHYMYLYKY